MHLEGRKIAFLATDGVEQIELTEEFAEGTHPKQAEALAPGSTPSSTTGGTRTR